MSIWEYLTKRIPRTAIKVVGIKEMPNHNDTEKEDILLNMFLGDSKSEWARKTELVDPKSLEVAFNFIF